MAGCVTCKSKRLKCDETKPSCNQCHKRHVQCGGYKKDFKWRPFEESRFVHKQPLSSLARARRGMHNRLYSRAKGQLPLTAPVVISMASMTSTLKGRARSGQSCAVRCISLSTSLTRILSRSSRRYPSTMPPQQNGFMQPPNSLQFRSVRHTCCRKRYRGMMPRSHPELFHSSSIDSTGSIFDE